MATESFTVPSLYSDLRQTTQMTALASNDITAGQVVGIITASNKIIPSLTGASDGSENIVGVALEDADTSAGDAVTLIGTAGDFNSNEVDFNDHSTTNFNTLLRITLKEAGLNMSALDS